MNFLPHARPGVLFALGLAVACGRPAAPPPPAQPSAEGKGTSPADASLAGTSWRLVQFEGGDGAVLAPDDPAKYTLAFDAEGAVEVRLDCNRGRGAWKTSGPNHLELGPLALTRAQCADPTIHDHIVKQWPYVRSYVLRDGRLYLALMADGGIYEFEPTASR